MRLIEKLELAAFQGALQLGIARHLAERFRPQALVEVAGTVAALTHGLVERQIGAGKELFGVVAVLRMDGDADACADIDRSAVDHYGFGDRRDYPMGQ